MRILLFANHFNTGGISSYLLTLTRGLTALGNNVYVASAGGNLVSVLEKAGGRHYDIGFLTKCEVNPIILARLPALVRFVKQEKIQLLHANTRLGQVLCALVSIITGVPYVSTCHGYFRARLGRLLFPCWGEKVIAISPAVKDHLQRDFKVGPGKIKLVLHGIEEETAAPVDESFKKKLRADMGLSGGPFVGIIARLSDVKGHSFLIEAMPDVLREFPEARCLIIGEGPMEQELKSKVALKSLQSSVLFFPVVNKSLEMLRLLDCFALPSLSEGLGLSVMEAQLAGLPVVASAVGGLKDLIEENVTGLLVPPRNAEALARALKQVLRDKDLALRLGQNGRARILERYSARQMVKKTLEVYEEIL